MRNQPDQIEDDSVEVATIMQLLEGKVLPHVTKLEEAVRRQIERVGIHSKMHPDDLADVINTAEGTDDIHFGPGDPRD